jgi:hypothetical protein
MAQEARPHRASAASAARRLTGWDSLWASAQREQPSTQRRASTLRNGKLPRLAQRALRETVRHERVVRQTRPRRRVWCHQRPLLLQV